jgi:hypothetical protein
MREIWGGFEETLRAGVSALEDAAQGAAALLEEAGAHAGGRLDDQQVDSEGKVHAFQLLTAGRRHEQMSEGTRRAIDTARERLDGELKPAMLDALHALHEEALPTLSAALEQAAEVAGNGVEVMGSLAAFAPPLAWAHGVVGTIGDLLDAMNLGL